jgi:hypothetical protein
MKRSLKQRIAFGRKLGFSAKDARALARLESPADVQDFVSSLKMNHEPGGDTCRSAAEVLKMRRGALHRGGVRRGGGAVDDGV